MNRAHSITLIAAGSLLGSGGCKQVDQRPAEWAYISPAIFQPNCATPSCHSPAAAVSGIDFSTPENGYDSLTKLWVWVVFAPDAATPLRVPCAKRNGTLVCEEQERPLVTPYDPAGSRIVNMLRATNAPRMPPDRPLPEADIELVERWILNGALEYPNGARLVDAGRTDAADARPSDARNGADAKNASDARNSDGAHADGSDAARDRGRD